MRRPSLTAALLLTVLSVTGCADSLLLHPRTHVPPAIGATPTTIPFHGGTLQIWTCRADPAQEPRAYVLECCGNATVAEDVVVNTAHRWRQANAEVWALNYPGYGDSTGPATLRAIPPAALAAFDAMRSAAGGKPVYVVGRSIGTTAALHVAAHRPVDGVVLHSPTALPDVILGRFGWWNLWIAASAVALQVPHDLDSVANARHCTAPAVFVITDADTLVVPAVQRRVIHAYAGPHRDVSLPNAGHNAPPDSAEEAEIESAIQWMRDARRPPAR